MWATLFAIVAGACDRGAGAPADGTAQMADTLAAIYVRQAANPLRGTFLNTERVVAMEKSLASMTGGNVMQARYVLAQERLLAGQSRAAIADLEAIGKAASLKLLASQPQNKPFFDLLGIAYLRLAEQENCVSNPSANVCILPLAGSARHKQEEGARRAISLYEAMITEFPDDRGSMWLLNVAQMAVGGYPYSIKKEWRIPGLQLKQNPSFPLFPNIAGELGLGTMGLSGGLAVEDFNRDGLLDVFMTSSGIADPPHLFLADGRGGYVDRTEAAGIARITGGLNVIQADYDNDGYGDLYVLRGAWHGDVDRFPNSLLRNKGDGTFEDVTFKAGLGTFHPTQTAAWADFNLDGWLDLVVGNESGIPRGEGSHRSELFVNNRDGTFTEVSHDVGIDVDAFVKAVAWGDINDDGLPDLYVSILDAPNRLFVNQGGPSARRWRFAEVTGAAGAAQPMQSFASWFWDFDQDGHEDLLVLSYDISQSASVQEPVALEYLGLPIGIPRADGSVAPIDQPRLYRNDGKGGFSDVSKAAGLANKAIFAMGANFGDLDNDGWLDFHVGTGNPDLRSIVPNRMFRNVGGRRFEDVSIDGGFAHIQKGHGTAFADLDRDGDEDVFMEMGGAYSGDGFASVLYENPGWPGRAWVKLELEGVTANRSAIGARVAVVAVDAGGAARTVYRTVGTGGSFGSGPLQLHVGLDRATMVREVRVIWPDSVRSSNTYTDIAVGQAYRIVQGQAPELLQRPPVPFNKQAPKPMAGMPGMSKP